MNRRLASTFGGITVAAALLFASSASAATLVGDYQLQGTHSSSGPGAALADVGAGANTSQNDTVMGSARQVLSFPLHNGLKLTPTGITASTFSVVMTFRIASLSGTTNDYVRILDSSNGTEDRGFYIHAGKADYFDADDTDHETLLPLLVSPNVHATVAMTQASAPARSAMYLNGALAAESTTSDLVLGDTLRFFKDDFNNEESAGAVSCIRVYNGVLTSAEVAAIGASPTCGTVAAPVTPESPAPATTPVTPHKKKCKKHKKKRSAESAKKKCKKHKKKR